MKLIPLLSLAIVLWQNPTTVALAGPTTIPQPNFVFILTDDQSWEALGCTGGEVKTPNLDRLAKRGMLFTHGYNMGSWAEAVCLASRTMFNIGRTLWHSSEIDRQARAQRSLASRKVTAIPPETGTTWSQWLEAAGYDTYFTGKWHVATHEVRKVFNVLGTVRPAMANDTPDGYNRPNTADNRSWLPWDTSKGGHWEGERHWCEITADESIGFLQAASRRPDPFFLYVAFNSPHDPRQSPRRYVEMYPIDQVRIPSNFLPDYPYRHEIGLSDKQRDERLAQHPRTPFAVQVHRQEYFALVTFLDAQIGRILDALDAAGLSENTYIFFTSDQGLSVGHHGLFGKQNMYDDSLCAPIIVTGPGVTPGCRTNARVYIQDIVPTTLALAGVPAPPTLEFDSLLPLLQGKTNLGRERIYAAFMGFQRAVIEGDWKLIYYPVARVYRLFNLATDSEEMHDLAADPSSAGRLANLQKVLLAEMAAQDDPMVSTNTTLEH